MATHGSVGEFAPGKETWLSYAERLEQYFLANDVQAQEKKRAILLSICGASTYQLIRNLVSPQKPSEKTFDELVKLVQEHHQPPPSVTVQRFAFHSRNRKNGESIADFVAHLRELSEHCQFGDTLNDMLRDRLICGCNDDRLQRLLLAKPPPLTFDKAFTLAQAHESAERSAKDLLKPDAAQVNSLKGRRDPNITRDRVVSNECYRCRGAHSPAVCRFKDVVCSYCKKTGHIARACRTKQGSAHKDAYKGTHNTRRKNQRDTSKRAHQITDSEADHSPSESTYTLFNMNSNRVKPIQVTVNVNGADITMEVDTGASVSIISEAAYRKYWKKGQAPPIVSSSTNLKTYTGEKLSIKGVINVTVKYEDQCHSLQLTVVKGSGPSLLGRDWLLKIKLNWEKLQLNYVRPKALKLEDILNRYNVLFKDELGRVQSTQAKLHVDPHSQPKFFRPRPIPYALRGKVEQELERLEKTGILEPVEFSDWAAPIVPVMKRDGTVRVCGDYKLTINQAAKLDTYPLPKADDLFSQLAGGKKFTKLDLAHAYQQIALEPDSRQYLTINTHKGLYQYTRLPFGVHSAPAIFQRTIEGILRGIKNVAVYIDDILITGVSEEEHLQTLDKVLSRLEAEGMRLKRDKCAFMLSRVEYLGHVITAEGLHPAEDKIRAILKAPAPHNVAQLRSFIGLVNYYGKFLHQLSTMLAPLYTLLQKNMKWFWGPDQKKAFSDIKKILTSPKLLVHYDPQKKLILSCDASPYGIGAVLSHVMEDGSEKPVAFASRSLAPAEKKYSQLDKEALAIVFGVKKFHHYLFGRHFTICSDHKPLQHLFSENRLIPSLASARIQRWALTLSAYEYNIIYKSGNANANADLLSRLPLPETISDVPIPGELILLMETLQSSPITAMKIKSWTDKDPILARVRNCIQKGWTNSSADDLCPFSQRKEELSVHDGCILLGCRVVIPKVGREQVLNQLHESHPGIVRMKSLARSTVWWPGIDKDIEKKVKSCQQCQYNQKSLAAVPMHPWEWPKRPWSRIHVDHAGPFQNKIFLIVIDAHSKWLEVIVVPSTSSSNTIRALRTLFATHGLPEVVVSDNGTAFTSSEFQEFMKKNGIQHLRSAPYHPSSNGLAERGVQIFKEGLKKMTDGDMETRLARLLYHYRITPHSTTGVSPAELLMGRKLRCHLDLLQPDTSSRVLDKQRTQKKQHDKKTKDRTFKLHDPVFVKDFTHHRRWLPGCITGFEGSQTAVIKLNDGTITRRHFDHLRIRSCDSPTEIQDDLPLDLSSEQDTPPDVIETRQVSTTTQPVELRRSTRIRHSPKRFIPGIG